MIVAFYPPDSCYNFSALFTALTPQERNLHFLFHDREEKETLSISLHESCQAFEVDEERTSRSGVEAE